MIVIVMTILRTPHICCCHAVTTPSSVTCHVSRVTIMNIVLFRGHMPPVLCAAKLWLLIMIRPHGTSAPPGGGWWMVMVGKTELFRGVAGQSNILKTLSSTFSACQKGFAQCPCFKAILFLVCHVYSDNI